MENLINFRFNDNEIVFEMNNGTTGPSDMFSNKMWINGIQQTLVNAGSPSLSNQNFNGGNGALAKYKSMTPQFGPGNNYNGVNDYASFIRNLNNNNTKWSSHIAY